MRYKQTTPPGQKRMVEDIDRRVNILFDGLNCETVSKPVVDGLLTLTKAIQARDRAAATAIYVDLLTKALPTEEIGTWATGVKQLINRL